MGEMENGRRRWRRMGEGRIMGGEKVTSIKMAAAVLLFAVAVVAGQPYTEGEEELYDYGGEGEERTEVVSLQTPTFVSESMKILVNEGDTIRLPCIVDRLEGFVMLWKKNGEIITVASQIIDKNVRLEETENGNHLVIGQATPEAEGTYTCQISAYRPTELTHRVRIRVKPVIITSPEEAVRGVAGTSVRLSCTAVAGSPKPSIQWKREGVARGEGGNMVISTLNRHHAGKYTCEADNGFGPNPVTKEVVLEVEHPPEVRSELEVMRTDVGESLELVCSVHSNPVSEVVWSRDGVNIDGRTPSVLINSAGVRHSLTLLSIREGMLGDYACTASNKHGTSSATIQVTGAAEEAVVTSEEESEDVESKRLSWRAISKSKATVFKVSVRPEGSPAWTQHEVPATQEEGSTDYSGSLILSRLQPATRYEFLISTKNAFGFNKPTNVFSFATKGAEPRQMSATSGCQSSSQTFDLFLIGAVAPLVMMIRSKSRLLMV